MSKFRVTIGALLIEKLGEDGQYHHFSTPTCGAIFSNLDRRQMKLVEGLHVEGVNRLHAEGMSHRDVAPPQPLHNPHPNGPQATKRK